MIPNSAPPEGPKRLLLAVKSLLVGTVAFTMGNGLLGAVLSHGMQAAVFPGLELGGFRAKRIILRIRHIRVFAASALAPRLSQAFFFNPAAWIILRIINGFCIAGMTTTIESWLNERSSNETRGRAPGVYMLCFHLAITVGQTLVNVMPVEGSDHSMISVALIGLSLIPVALTRLGEPDQCELRVFGDRIPFMASCIGLVGAGVAGMLVGSFAALGVVFVRPIGLSVSEAVMFMSTVMIGDLAFQLSLGALADRFDRRIVTSCILVTVGTSRLYLSNLIATGAPLLLLGMALIPSG